MDDGIKAIIVDIDGTLAVRGHRDPYDMTQVHLDPINEPIKILVNTYALKLYRILIFSGRDERCRLETGLWLAKHQVFYHALYMRPAKSGEKDAVVKRQMYEAYVAGKYQVEFVLDDRDTVVKMWREELGLLCLQVNYGDF